eukprot:1178432-Prorocentrum_minimum.AAC.4
MMRAAAALRLGSSCSGREGRSNALPGVKTSRMFNSHVKASLRLRCALSSRHSLSAHAPGTTPTPEYNSMRAHACPSASNASAAPAPPPADKPLRIRG